jgi:hypothetical protein
VHDPDRIAAALSRLAPESRALVELSYRRGLGDDEIGELLGVEPEEVARRREAAVSGLGVTGDQLDEYWNPGKDQEPVATAPAAAAPARRRVPVALLAALALAAVVLLIVVLASGGDSDEGTTAQAPASEGGTTTESAAPTPANPPRPMQRLNGTYGRGTAQLVRSGERTVLRLNVAHFLQPQGGGYAVWLYNSPDDARRLYATTATSIERDIPLPGNFARYRYAEVARAIPDLDSDHSGLSLLRTRLAALSDR